MADATEERNGRLGHELCKQADLVVLDELGLAMQRPTENVTILAAECSWSLAGATLRLRVGTDAESMVPVLDRADAAPVAIAGATRAARFASPLADRAEVGAAVVVLGPRGFGVVEALGVAADPAQLISTATHLAATLERR